MRANARHAGSIPLKTGWAAQNARFVSANIEFRFSKHEAALLFCHHPPTIRSQKWQEFCYPLQPQKRSQTASGPGAFSFFANFAAGDGSWIGPAVVLWIGPVVAKKNKKRQKSGSCGVRVLALINNMNYMNHFEVSDAWSVN